MTRQRKWTVMVWLAGDNDLEDFALTDLKEMKSVGSNEEINVVAQLDRMSDHNTRRYYLRKNTSLKEDVVQELGETNTGDPDVAIDFFTWGQKKHPAKHYLAVLWNHGSGIDESDLWRFAEVRGLKVHRKPISPEEVPRSRIRTIVSRQFDRALFGTTIASALPPAQNVASEGTVMKARAIAIDETSRDFLDNIELKRVLSQVAKRTGNLIDIVGFDACLMSMVEIACQLQDTTRFLVGSQETEPGDGWPYDRILSSLSSNADVTPRALCGAIVKGFVDSYKSSGEDVTQSALDLGKLPVVVQKLDSLAKALVRSVGVPEEYAAITKALRAAQGYFLRDFVDLHSLSEEISQRCQTSQVKEAAGAVMRSIKAGGRGLVAAEEHRGAKVSRSHGVSVYFPRVRDVSVSYPRLDFARATHWGDFLAAYNRQQ